jgi:nickel-dependent lactate racemase
MTSTLRFGPGLPLTLDLPAAAVVADCGRPGGEPLDDPAAAMAAALHAPLDMPALAHCVVAGDHVTLALDTGLPQGPALVAGVVSTLLEAGLEADDISILRTIDDTRSSADDPRDALPAGVAEQIELVTHDPACRGELRYLAATTEGRPIYLNRRLHEADLVLPIGCLRVHSAPGYHGIHGGLYPAFSDERTRRRFRGALPKGLRAANCRQEADEVAWLLGLTMTIQVVPAGDGQVLHILAGETSEVMRQGRRLCEQAWRTSVPRRASLVVAAIDGGPTQQTWDNVARALSAARRVVAEGGAIALCTELADAPGPALMQLTEPGNRDEALRVIRKRRFADAAAARELLKSTDRANVYLLSRLESEQVESLGVAPVADAGELTRLSRRYPSCILLSSAQYAAVALEKKCR